MCNCGVDVKDGENPMKKKEWDTNCWRWEMKPEDFGKEIIVRGEVYKIYGCKPKSSKYPILGKDLKSGKVYKLPVYAVKMGVN